MHLLKYLIALVILCLSSSAYSKVITQVLDEKNQIATIKIVKRIEFGEEDDFIRALDWLVDNKYKLKLNAIQLDSTGGNTYSARTIGRIIKDKRLNTYLAKKKTCASACVDILIAGIERYAFGDVDIHRGTYRLPGNIANYEEVLEDTKKEFLDYFNEMDQSFVFADAIYAVPSYTTHTLSKYEKYFWGVVGTSQLYDELWRRQIYDETGFDGDKIHKSLYKNYEYCKSKVKKFQDSYWTCQKEILLKMPRDYTKLPRATDCDALSYDEREVLLQCENPK
jgi:hypothetical protein